MIRGYGHVKARHLDAARPKWDALMADWRAGPLRIGAPAADSRLAGLDAQDSVSTTQPFDSQLSI
jgi:hypothetical protein